ncbi:unnamed protein product, partial [Prorocentrum cordatum]
EGDAPAAAAVGFLQEALESSGLPEDYATPAQGHARAADQHRAWLQGRPSGLKPELDKQTRLAQQHRHAAKLWRAEAISFEDGHPEAHRDARQRVLLEMSRAQYLRHVGHAVVHLKAATNHLQTATRQLRMAAKDKDIRDLGAHDLVFFAPNICELSWAEALDALHDEIDRLDFLAQPCARAGPYEAKTLYAIGEFFRDNAAASLRDIVSCWADHVPRTKPSEFIDQLCGALPLLVVDVRFAGRGAPSFDNVWLLALDKLPNDGAVYFWSLLDKANNTWAKLQAEGQAALEDRGGASEPAAVAPELSSCPPPGRGRPRTEDTPHGLAIVKFLTDYIRSHGQPATDAHRLCTTPRVVGASLTMMSKAAKIAGLPVKRSAIYALMQKPRHNPRPESSPCRSIIPARPGGLVCSEKKFHARSAWSATKMKYACQFATMQKAAGFRAGELHVDSMSKVPYFPTAPP